MQTTAHVRDSSWDEVAVHYDHVPEKQVTYFYVKRPRNELFEPWLVRAPSALLARRGVRRMGLYAGRRFVSEGVIGKYETVELWRAMRLVKLPSQLTRRDTSFGRGRTSSG